MMHDKQVEDSILVKQLIQGNAKAFEALYNKYWEPLFMAATRRVGSQEMAKELLQDVFVNLWQRRDQLNIKSSFAAYLHTALKYKVLDYIRAQSVKEKYIQAIKGVATPGNTTAEMTAYHELKNSLEEEVADLPERCRLVFKMSRFDHYSNKEIANKLHISPKTVENQIGKALKILRINLNEYLKLLPLLFTSYFT